MDEGYNDKKKDCIKCVNRFELLSKTLDDIDVCVVQLIKNNIDVEEVTEELK